MSKTDYAGIDYGLGQTNIDQETGIRFGVIRHKEVGQSWYEASEPHFPNVCPFCGDDLDSQRQNLVYPTQCLACKNELTEKDFDDQEPSSYYFIDDHYSAEQGADSVDIFVLLSPYFTFAQFCSPCAPGAGYLTNWTEPNVGPKAYCFGQDWFWDTETGKAPYPVYEVGVKYLSRVV